VDVQNVKGRQRIVIGTTGAVTYQVQESAEPASLTVDVAGAAIEAAASRTLDLRQVSSPIARVRASQLRGAPDPVVRVAADLKSAVKHEVRQTPSAIVVDLLPAPERAAAPMVAQAAGPTAAPVEAPAAVTPAARTAAPNPAAAPIVTPAVAPAPAPPAAPGSPWISRKPTSTTCCGSLPKSAG
jgi:hypothetical protein